MWPCTSYSAFLCEDVGLRVASLHICRHQTSLGAIRQVPSAPQWTTRLQKSFFVLFSFHISKDKLGMWQMEKKLVSFETFPVLDRMKKVWNLAREGRGGCLNGQRKQEGTTHPYNSCQCGFRKFESPYHHQQQDSFEGEYLRHNPPI